MALKRAMLKGMGLTDEQVNAIIEAHTDTVDGLKEELKKHDGDAQRIKDLEEKLKGYEGGEDWKKRHDDLKAEYDQYKTGVTAKENEAKVRAAYRKLLVDAKLDPDMIDVVLRATDFKDMKLDAEGKLENTDRLTEAIKSDWGKFIVTEGRQGADVQTPPGGGKVTRTRDEIMAITDTAERQKAIAENHELFGF